MMEYNKPQIESIDVNIVQIGKLSIDVNMNEMKMN